MPIPHLYVYKTVLLETLKQKLPKAVILKVEDGGNEHSPSIRIIRILRIQICFSVFQTIHYITEMLIRPLMKDALSSFLSTLPLPHPFENHCV